MKNTSVGHKVLLITPSIDMGGMQRAMSTLANSLVDLGIEVEMYALFKNSHFLELSPKIAFSEPSKSPKQQNPISRLISVIKAVRKKVRKSDAQHIIVYGRYYSSLVMFACLGLGKRIYISDRASPLYRDPIFARTVTDLICKFIKPAGIIAQTCVSAEYQQKRFGGNIPIEVIPNAVREMNIQTCSHEDIVLAVGRFGDPLKGFDRLIEAWGMVKQSGWKLVFAGGTESECPEFAQRAKDLSVRDSIEFLGKVDNIDEWYSKSSIFVIPSRSEGFPNALAEAMVAGMACVSFDFIAGPRDIIIDKVNGIIVPDGDCAGLADAITYLIHNPDKRTEYGEMAATLKNKLTHRIICQRVIDFVFNEY